MATPARTPAATPPGELRITGVLSSPAELSTEPSASGQGAAWLTLHIDLGAGLPVVAAQRLGTDPAVYIAARAKARALQRGAQVTVYARGLSPRTDHGAAVLRLHQVTDVVPATTPNRAEPGAIHEA